MDGLAHRYAATLPSAVEAEVQDVLFSSRRELREAEEVSSGGADRPRAVVFGADVMG